MSNKNYQPKDFFRRAPHDLLVQYFSRHDVLGEIDFVDKSDEQIEGLFKAFQALDEQLHSKMEADFQEIHNLSTEGGIKALMDEADFHGDDLVDLFAQNAVEGFEAQAFWVFLNRPNCWQGAKAFNRADSLFTSWEKLSGIGSQPAKVDLDSIATFASELGAFFNEKGMGKRCKVDNFHRVDNGKELEYFFTYPEDFARNDLAWKEELKLDPRRAALEIIFVYCQADGELDVWSKESKAVKKALQKIFANAILGIELPKPVKEKKEYELESFKNPNSPLKFDAQSGVESIRVNKLRFTLTGSKERITIEANNSRNPNAVYDLYDKLKARLPEQNLNVTHVGLLATFDEVVGNKQKTKQFSLTFPNSCSLKHTQDEAILRQILVDSGVQPKPVIKPAKAKKAEVKHDGE
jgi:hypothetical protein